MQPFTPGAKGLPNRTDTVDTGITSTNLTDERGAMRQNRLQLVWPNKDRKLLTHGVDTYEWVEPQDWRATEVRLLEHVQDVGDAAAGNLVIHGDALHALTSLTQLPELRAEYLGKVKLCYIDPPFNTGQAFSHYNDAVEHSVWLTMMRDRLVQIRQLLSDDGSVWVHLDDVEVHRMRSVLDEVFGAENAVTSFLWRKVDSPNDNKVTVTPDHETLLVYGKTKGVATRWIRKDDPALINAFGGVAEDGRRYRDRLLKKNGKNSLREDRPTMWFAVPDPDGNEVWPIHDDGREACWSLGKDTVARLLKEDALIWKKRPGRRRRGEVGALHTRVGGRRAHPPLADHLDRPADDAAGQEAPAEHVPGQRELFATPKPEHLLRRVIEIATRPGEVVLDCFGGSGTTAAVALKTGRRFVTVEVLQETLDTFLLPRLAKVVDGSDDGGVSNSVTDVPAGSLPEDLTTTDAKRALAAVRSLAEEGRFDDVLDAKTRKAVEQVLREAGRTVKAPTGTGWTGGSGFRVLRIAESMFTADDDGDLYLADGLHDENLDRAVCAQMRYDLRPGRAVRRPQGKVTIGRLGRDGHGGSHPPPGRGTRGRRDASGRRPGHR